MRAIVKRYSRFITFGHRSDSAYQLLVLGSFAVMVATLFALYRHEERRRDSRSD